MELSASIIASNDHFGMMMPPVDQDDEQVTLEEFMTSFNLMIDRIKEAEAARQEEKLKTKARVFQKGSRDIPMISLEHPTLSVRELLDQLMADIKNEGESMFVNVS